MHAIVQAGELSDPTLSVPTSATQFYRLLDQTNYRKSVDQVLTLLHVLDCDVDVIVSDKALEAGAPDR